MRRHAHCRQKLLPVIGLLLLLTPVKADRTAWTWGYNFYGQLGIGTNQTPSRPTEVVGLRDVLKVALGSNHGIALLADGTVWAWGYGGSGQLGDGTWGWTYSPVKVLGLSDVIDIAAGNSHCLALRADGTVWAWGDNSWGQLGNGTQINSNVPVQANISGVRAIAAGAFHSLAIRALGGFVWAWGKNDEGQLGDGTTEYRTWPVPVQGISGARMVAGGSWHSLALLANGTVFAWGANQWGQLGDGTNEQRLHPVIVSGLMGIRGIAAGDLHSLAWSHYTAYAWGANFYGQLGDGTQVAANTPIPIIVGLSLRKMAGGWAHSLAVDTSGGMWAWGWGGFGQLGRGDDESALLPVPITVPGNVVDIAASLYQSATVRWETSTMAWGENSEGQVGDGSLQGRLQPVLSAGLLGSDSSIQLAAGATHSAALEVGGAVWAWGGNAYGQLGTGDTERRTTPVRVSEYGAVVALAAGAYHSVGLGSDGRVYSCGLNTYGQLGDGTNLNRSSVVPALELDGIIAVAAGGYHTLALRSDGTVFAWGRNDSGQLGIGTTADQWAPVQVPGLSGVTGIAAGADHSLAVLADGSVFAWGGNTYGQLGDGTTIDRWTPVFVGSLEQITDVEAGEGFSLFRKVDGTLWAAGRNNFGQLGIGSWQNTSAPAQVVNLNHVIRFAAGGNHSAAIKADGTTWTWGLNTSGQLGDGSTTSRNVPGLVYWPSFPINACGITAGYAHTLAITTYSLSSLEVTPQTSQAGQTVQLTATLTHLGNPIPNQLITFFLDGEPLGIASTDDFGIARLNLKVPDTSATGWAYTVLAAYVGGEFVPPGTYGAASLAYTPAPTAMFTLDRTGTVGEIVTLRAYLRRLTDNAWIPNRMVTFYVDGLWGGDALTNAAGRADRDHTVSPPAGTRTIQAVFLGDRFYAPADAYATLTAVVWTTRMATFDRTARITGRTELKARLVRSDSVPIYNKRIRFYVDGTFIIERPTNTQGYASYPYYDVPDEAGAGTRTILCEWPGDDGYLPISKTATLTVLKALPYIWVMPRSVPQGGTYRLYCYFRRLYDYAKMQSKTLAFSIDGTWIADVLTGNRDTGEPGVARYNFDTSGLAKGDHVVRCEWAGDPWVDAGYGEARLTIY